MKPESLMIDKELDALPAITRFIEASKAGKLDWQPSADRGAFLASVGAEHSFRVQIVHLATIDEFGDRDMFEAPQLDMLDQKGVCSGQSIRAARTATRCGSCSNWRVRIGNRLDERLDRVVNALDKL